MKRLLLLAFSLILSASAFAQYQADPAHSSVNFTIKHMNISFVQGRFDKFNGTLDYTKPDFSDAKINFTVDVNSVNTAIEARDKHLKTADFFDVEKYGTMKFVSTSVKKTAANTYLLTGNLTIKDVTKPATFKLVHVGTTKDKNGKPKVGFRATANINRFDYHINYDPTGNALGKDVEIVVNAEMAHN